MSFTAFNFDNVRKEPLGTVYVVDDDLDVRDSMRRLLESQDYRVEAFDSGESFLAKFDPNAIAVLLIDQRASGKSDGHTITFGINESKDALVWINYLEERFGRCCTKS